MPSEDVARFFPPKITAIQTEKCRPQNTFNFHINHSLVTPATRSIRTVPLLGKQNACALNNLGHLSEKL
ncbi:hypothetical protein D3C86_2033680 [compost metagenome]